jgi:MFS family permease
VADGVGTEGGSLTPRQRRALTRVTSDRSIVAVLAGTGLLASFMQTLVTPIIPSLPKLLQTTAADSSWVLVSTLLAAAISIPISGRLGDMYGKRRIMLLLLAIMLGGSIVAGISNTLIPMIVGRVLQGIGLGVIAMGVSILRDVVHPRNLGGAVALVSATLGVGGAVGLPIAAVIVQYLDWHYLFWLSTVLGIAAIIAVATIVPPSTLRTGGRFDFPGAAGLAVGLVCILLGISKGSEWGWSAGVVVLVGWGILELRTGNPLVDLRVAARRTVLLTNLTSIAMGFAFFIVTASTPIVLEAPASSGVGLGLPLIAASLCLMPLGLVMFVTSPVSARLTAWKGPRTSLILGGLIVFIGFVVAVFLLDEVWHIVLVSTITGLGIGFAYGAMPTLIMRSVPPSETAAANGLNSVMRTLGSTLSATIVGVILSTHLVTTGGAGTPSRDAFAIVFVIGAATVLMGVVIALFIPRHTPGHETASIPVQHES